MAQLTLTALVLLFFGLLLYVYDGYLRLLRVVVHFKTHPDRVARPACELPTVAVVIAVHNEAHQIGERVQNVLDQNYPRELLEVVLASDGSTDELAAVVAGRFGAEVRLVHADRRVGKSAIQNQAVESIRASIVVFSDADTRFDPDFLTELVLPFSDDAVGAVQAHLLFVPAEASSASASQARYWRSELEIRQLEANLHILAVASGACIAVRRDLWHPLDPAIGEDCMIPLDVVLQSRTVEYADRAIAYEPADEELEDVIRTRARMTLRNWQGTWSRRALLNPFAHPGYALALWSHKILRWLSPVWLLGLSISAFALPFASPPRVLLVPAAAMLAFYVLGIVGALAATRSRRVPVATEIYAFILANVGFLGGLVKAARGHTMTSYR